MGYAFGSYRVGVYWSRLEAYWAAWFRKRGHRAEYVGNALRYADFRLTPAHGHPFHLEVKPEMEDCPALDWFFVTAVDRLRSSPLDSCALVFGRPSWHPSWWIWSRYRPLFRLDPTKLGQATLREQKEAARAQLSKLWGDPFDPAILDIRSNREWEAAHNAEWLDELAFAVWVLGGKP